MHRLSVWLLVGSFAGCTSGGDYRTAWCEKFCGGVISQTCREECARGEVDDAGDDAGRIDAGVGDAGSDAGEVDAGDVDAGDVDAGVNADAGLILVLESPAASLSAGVCSPLQLSIQDSHGALIGGQVTLSALGGLTMSSDAACAATTNKLTIGTSRTQKIPLSVLSASAGVFSVVLTSPQATERKVAFEFRARINVTSDNLDAGCTLWRARLLSTNAENRAVNAVGEVLWPSPNLTWLDSACKTPLDKVQLNFANFTLFFVKQGDEGFLSPAASYINPAQLTATVASGTEGNMCTKGSDCRTRSCSGGSCACVEKGSATAAATECCSLTSASGVCL